MAHSRPSILPRPDHPDAEVLTRFIQGKLDGTLMAELERHVDACDQCCRTLLAVPDDRLAALLRRREAKGQA